MKVCIFDLEADGFLADATKIHCIAYAYFDGKHWTNVELRRGSDMLNVLNNCDVLVGHNISGYDIPLIKKLHPGEVNFDGVDIFDTYLASCLAQPDNTWGHSIEAWAKRLRLPQQKIGVTDWSKYTDLMGTRCKADVAINMEVYNKLKDTWLGKEKQVMQIECIVAGIHAEQEVYGVKYDVEKAKAFVKMIEEKTDELRKEITEGIPPIVKPGTTVKEPFKNNGELSVRAETWLKDHVNIYSVSHGHHHHYLPSKVGPFSKVEFIPFNLDSGPQVKDYLLSIGWKPQEFNFKKDPVTGKSEITSPKLTEESFGSLPPGLGRMIADYRIMMHRKRLVFSIKKNGGESGALTKVRADGRVPSEALTCGTPTSRYRHSGAVCNIPRPSTLYGPEIRELFTVPGDCLQIGIDLASIEARMMCHYALPYDGGKELAELVLHGDYHQYNADNWDVIRDLAKNGLYALIYGCGEAKLANTLDKPKGSGKKLFDDFWANNQALKYLLDDVNAAVDSGRDIRGLDRRVLSIRQKRKALNSLFQSGAAIVFKHWMRLCEQWIRDWNSKPGSSIHQIIAYHDELQFEITTTSISTATTVGISLSKLAEEAGRILKVKVPITAKYSVGHNWKECH